MILVGMVADRFFATERILSVSAQNIPTEYELTYKVEFSVVSEGKTLIEKEEIPEFGR